MKEKEFDNLIRARLKNHESPVTAGMWDRISVTGKKRRKGFATRLYLLTIVFLLIGLTGIFYTSNTRDQSTKEIPLAKTNPTKSNDKKNLIRSDNKEDHTKAPGNPEGINKVTGRNATSNRFTESPFTTHDSPKESFGTRFTMNSKNEKKRKKFSPDQEKFKPDDHVVLDNSKRIAGETSDNTSGGSIKETPKKETKAVKSEQGTNAEQVPIESGSDRFSVELFTSPSVPVNHISSDNKAYEDALKNSGTMQLSYTVGARISYAISKRLSAKTGVQYSQVNEKMNFTDPAGNNFTSTNHYKNIGVPLVLGYKVTSTKNMDVFVNTGIILNIASRYKGMIPSATGQPIDIKNENVYNTNASADLFLGINLSKKMNSRTDFFVEPWINYRFKNMVSHYYSFDQKINTLGLSLGLRYRLYKNEMSR